MPFMSANAGEFALSLNSWIGATNDALNQASRDAVKETFTKIIDRNPLDTTDPDEIVSKDCWVTGLDSEAQDTTRQSPSGSNAKQELEGKLNSWLPATGQVLYFSNYKVQSYLLEYGLYRPSKTSGRTPPDGFSTQAPGGYVAISLEEFDDNLAKAASRHKI